MLMILKKYNVTQVIIKCFHVPPAVCLRTPRGTRTPGWESLLYWIRFYIAAKISGRQLPHQHTLIKLTFFAASFMYGNQASCVLEFVVFVEQFDYR